MGLFIPTASKFACAFLGCTIACTFLWAHFVTGTIYNCTDSLWLDYLFPGHWVHDPVSITQVVGGRSMSEPDALKEGWSTARLWYLWFSFVGVSVAASAMLAWMPWTRENRV